MTEETEHQKAAYPQCAVPALCMALYEDWRSVPALSGCQRRSKIVRKRQRNFVVFWRNHVITSSVSLFKKCINDLLFLTHKFLAFFQAVRLTLDVDHGVVVARQDF